MNDVSAKARSKRILLVEDNDQDALLTLAGLDALGINVELSRVRNGSECMKFLHREVPYEGARLPDLILLDLNMPVMDGRSVLEQLSHEQSLRGVPVVVMTVSDDERDVHDTYRLQCNSYVSKPTSQEALQQLLSEICNYWFSVVVLPPRP